MWSGSLVLLFEFVQFMSSKVASIKFTMEVTCLPDCDRTDEHDCSPVLNFLDVSMWLEEGKIETDLFRKPNSKIQYLLPDWRLSSSLALLPWDCQVTGL